MADATVASRPRGTFLASIVYEDRAVSDYGRGLRGNSLSSH